MDMATLLLLPLMVVAFYFLLIRPQRKRAQDQQRLLDQLQPGERVLTHSGLFGTLVSIGPRQAVIELAPGVEVTVLKQAVARVVRPEDEDSADAVATGDTGDDLLDEMPATDTDRGIEPTRSTESEPYAAYEPSALDLPPQRAVDEPAAGSTGQAAGDEPGGIRDVTDRYFDRRAGDDRSNTERPADPERQSKDS